MGTIPITIDAVVQDVCARAGLKTSQVDTSLLTADNLSPTNQVLGYAVKRPMKATEILKPLMLAYFFDACETNGAIKFVPLGLDAVVTIPETDLGLLKDMAKLVERFAQEQDLPKNVQVNYDDPTFDYQPNHQRKGRNARIVNSTQQVFIDLAMTLLPDWAQQIAVKAVYLAWLQRSSYKINLWRASYLLLDPTDVVEFVYESLTFAMRIKQNSVGANLASALEGVAEYAELLVSGATGAPPGGPGSPLQTLSPTSLWLFDIPLLRDVDSNPENTGLYFAMSSASLTWGGGILLDSTDDENFTQPAGAASAQPVTFGVAQNALGAPRSPWAWDLTNTLTVNLQRGSFASDTPLNVLNGTNGLIVGSELIQFTTAVQNSDGSWTVSGLLRGRRGTEWACSSHVTGELVIVPGTGMQRIQLPLSVVNQQIYYKGVTAGQDPSTVAATEFTILGRDLMPYAPVQIKASRDGSGNLTFTWVRRTRVGWLNLAQDPVPLSEDFERYQLDIYNGSSVVRSITGLAGPTASYSAAQQTTDFGSPQTSVSVKVYQVSAQVGKGFAAAATVTAELSSGGSGGGSGGLVGKIISATSAALGAGYNAYDVVYVEGGNGDAVLTVTDVDEEGEVEEFEITNPGTGYGVAEYGTYGGSGDGNFAINVTQVG
ncbi:MAG: phage tail protein [Candidatus Acidiferrales bacterium]